LKLGFENIKKNYIFSIITPNNKTKFSRDSKNNSDEDQTIWNLREKLIVNKENPVNTVDLKKK
jgi:hypothetical protein